MRKLLVSSALATLVVGALAGLLFAQDRESSGLVRSELIAQMDRIIKTYCDVYVGNSHPTPSTRCRRNEVVTGIQKDGLYCSSITVECFGKQIILNPEE